MDQSSMDQWIMDAGGFCFCCFSSASSPTPSSSFSHKFFFPHISHMWGPSHSATSPRQAAKKNGKRLQDKNHNKNKQKWKITEMKNEPRIEAESDESRLTLMLFDFAPLSSVSRYLFPLSKFVLVFRKFLQSGFL